MFFIFLLDYYPTLEEHQIIFFYTALFHSWSLIFFFTTCTTLHCNIHTVCKPPWSCKQSILIMTNNCLACIITYWFWLAVVRESQKGESKVNCKHNMNTSCNSKSTWATCWAVICLIWICTHSLNIQSCSLAVFFAVSVARLVSFFPPSWKHSLTTI